MRTLALLLVSLSAWLAPRHLRARWREEWLGEIEAASKMEAGSLDPAGSAGLKSRPPSASRLLRRALGAPRDALALRRAGAAIGRPQRRSASLFAGLPSDIRDAMRALAKTPLQTGVVLLSLTLGSTLAVMMFAVVNAMYGGALPGVEEQDRVVKIVIHRGGRARHFTMGTFGALPPQIPGLVSYGAEVPWRFSARVQGSPVATKGLFVSGAYFETLGTRPAAGRLLQRGDDHRDAPPVVVIGHGFWQLRFAGAADAIGATVAIGTGAYQVVGVAPAGFVGLDSGDFGQVAAERGDLWLPMSRMWTYSDFYAARAPDATGPQIAGRLEPGLSQAEASARAQSLIGMLNATPSKDAPVAAIELRPLSLFSASDDAWEVAALIGALMFVPMMVLAIACANVAGVQLARAIGRTHELAVRVSLGATRWRLARLLLTETVLVALVSGVTAWAIATQVLRLSGSVLPFVASADSRVLAFAIVLPVTVALLAGLLPAWRATGFDVLAGLRLGSRVGRVASPRLRRAVVVLQLAVSVALLAGAAVTLRGLGGLPTAIGPLLEDVVMISVRFSDLGFSAAQERDLRDDIVGRLQALQGTSVAVAAQLPFHSSGGLCWTGDNDRADPWTAFGNVPVSPEYFSLLRLRALQGRTFGASDAPTAVVVNRAFAAAQPPGTAVVGMPVRLTRASLPDGLRVRAGEQLPDGIGKSKIVGQVIGVVEDSYERVPRGAPRPRCYVPLTRADAGLVVYLSGPNPDALLGFARATLTAADPRLTAPEAGTLATILRTRYRWLYWLSDGLAAIGAMALALAAIGLFGVMTYAVSLRTHEFGVRLALGARPVEVAAAVVRESLGVTAVGGVLGIGLSIPLALLFRNAFITNIAWLDPVAILLVFVAIATIGACAALLPARRVARIDPVHALRSE